MRNCLLATLVRLMGFSLKRRVPAVSGVYDFEALIFFPVMLHLVGVQRVTSGLLEPLTFLGFQKRLSWQQKLGGVFDPWWRFFAPTWLSLSFLLGDIPNSEFLPFPKELGASRCEVQRGENHTSWENHAQQAD